MHLDAGTSPMAHMAAVTPLQIAIENVDAGLCAYLLLRGADPELPLRAVRQRPSAREYAARRAASLQNADDAANEVLRVFDDEAARKAQLEKLGRPEGVTS